MARKIIQVAAVPQSRSHYTAAIALCDDGSVWVSPSDETGVFNEWKPLPKIPQD